MTLALCFNCGHTKFGAICPCNECGVASTGDANLDIAFSDHHISAKTIEQFGQVVKMIEPLDEDPTVRFWVFMRFITEHHSDILAAEAPDELADRVDAAYRNATFPTIVVEPGMMRAEDLGPETTIEAPAELVSGYQEHYELFSGLASVEVRCYDGTIHRGAILNCTGGEQQIILGGDHPQLTTSDIAALRATRGCFLSFRRRPWVTVNGLE